MIVRHGNYELIPMKDWKHQFLYRIKSGILKS